MIAPGSHLVVATGNAGKLEELRALLADLGLLLHAQGALGIAPPEETGSTFVENALIKARSAARAAGMPAIADDSGLMVDALGGAPGVRSARYAGMHANDADNVQALLAALRSVPPQNRGAQFHCVVVALREPSDPAPLIASGVWRGSIALAPAGEGGFGYDPVFVDEDLELTAAQMPAELKNRRSHRFRALAALREQMASATSPGRIERLV